jgi:hypothetical protein
MAWRESKRRANDLRITPSFVKLLVFGSDWALLDLQLDQTQTFA